MLSCRYFPVTFLWQRDNNFEDPCALPRAFVATTAAASTLSWIAAHFEFNWMMTSNDTPVTQIMTVMTMVCSEMHLHYHTSRDHFTRPLAVAMGFVGSCLKTGQHSIFVIIREI